jgi:phosphopantetheinyl transferase
MRKCLGGDDEPVKATRDTGRQPVVHVLCAKVPLSLPDRTIGVWLDKLPASRRAALAQRLARGTGLESLTALALLASLATACRLPALARLEWTPRGKPRFPDGPEISLSHSSGFAACAVSPRGFDVGVDIEPADRASATAVRLVVRPEERRALDEGLLSPTGLWTAKEAVLKAAGAGLSDMRRVAVSDRRARLAGVDYGWRHFRAPHGLLLAVAVRGWLPAAHIRWPWPDSVFGFAA